MILTLVWLLVVFVISVYPTGGLQTGHQTDKVIHFIIYGLTAILFLRVLRLRTTLIKSVMLSIILVSFYGFAIELLQSALPWREFSFLDELANIGGAFFFSILYALWAYHKKRA